MKNSKVLLIVSIIFLSLNQISISQPKSILSFYGGFSAPLPQLSGQLGSSQVVAYQENYGMQTGLNVGLEFKYAFGKKGNFRGVMGYMGNFFINWTEVFTLGLVDVDRPTIEIGTWNIGGEYAFSPKEKLNPFVGAGLTINFIGGQSIESATRYGFQLGFGADIAVSNYVGFQGGIKYNLANLIGKDSDTSKFTTRREIPLNDGEYYYRGQHIGAKNISFLQMYLGIEFYLGGSGRGGKTKVIK